MIAAPINICITNKKIKTLFGTLDFLDLDVCFLPKVREVFREPVSAGGEP